ncbi:MAG: type I restriction endonuclease subunit R, partial [Anaerolineae bacterium]|nr:type I restriction endonuclease subunit R [Anaerolineae bacterium]
RAKAMIVTRSRLHAVRFKLAVDAYLQQQGYPFKSLVAFSGTVEDGANSYTETGMNTASAGKRIPESATAEVFKQADYRLLIVANKFQTGFDQPLLHTMYVDKKLGGVNAVQTLSRLNRTYKPHKKETMVLDFVNEADDIRRAFEPYYEATLLSEQTDPNVLYQLQAELDDTHLYDEDEIDVFVRAYLQGRRADLAALYALVDPVVDRVAEIDKEEQQAFRGRLNDFTRLYAFLSQILSFVETEWEKRFHFYRFLLRRILQRLPDARGSLPMDLYHQVDLDFYRVRETFDGYIELERGESELAPVGMGGRGGSETEQERDPLSVIIEELNRIYHIPTNGDAEAAIHHLRGKLEGDIALAKGSAANPPDTFRLLFDQIADEHFADMIDAFFKFYKQVTDNPQAKDRFFDWLFEQYQRGKTGGDR